MPLYPDFNRVYPTSVQTGQDTRPQDRLASSETLALTLEAGVDSFLAPALQSTVWLVFRGRDLMLFANGEEVLPLPDTADVHETLRSVEPIDLGNTGGIRFRAAEVPADFDLPATWRAIDLWQLHGRVPESIWVIAGYASHVLHWERTSRFCPVCGHASEPMAQEWMRRCPQCGHIRYPQISPAVLVLVHDGADRVLLCHQPGWREMYSILAGFVLPGESLEECVYREVQEEVGLNVTDLVYAGSQPWPFPQQLMIGFRACCRSGEIRIDEQELDRAEWFPAQALPPLPPTLSLSRQMLDAWLADRLS